jgi:Tfp pilus assembly protein PilE
MDAPSHPEPHTFRGSIRSERGLGLVELLVVVPMLAVVLMGIYVLYNVGANSQRHNSQRVAALLRQQNGLERMTREMRQAISFTPASSQILDGETFVRPPGGGASVEKHVRYECASGSCTRYEGVAGGTSFDTSEVVISDLQNVDVFFFEPDNVNPTYVTAKLEVKVKGADNPITLQGGFGLRNQKGG